MNFGDIWRALWRNKPILFAGIAVVALLVYLWWQNQQSGAQTATDGSTIPNTVPVDSGQGSGVPGVVTTNPTVTTSPIVNTSTPGTAQPTPAANWFSNITVPFVSPVSTPVPAPVPTQTAPRTYLVVAGDTLASVAKKLGITANQLYNDNRGTISLASSKHGGPYYDTGKATTSPPSGVKLYAGTVLSF